MVQLPCCSAAQLRPTLCDPVDCSMPGFPVHHHLPQLTHTHVHQVGDAIQPSHPLSLTSPPALNPSQHEGLLWLLINDRVLEVTSDSSRRLGDPRSACGL